MMMITPAITRNGMTTRRARDDSPRMRLLFGLLICGSLLTRPPIARWRGTSIYHHLSTIVDERGCPHDAEKARTCLVLLIIAAVMGVAVWQVNHLRPPSSTNGTDAGVG